MRVDVLWKNHCNTKLTKTADRFESFGRRRVGRRAGVERHRVRQVRPGHHFAVVEYLRFAQVGRNTDSVVC
jgi:hypothetical protein